MDRKEISKIVFRPNFFEIGLFRLQWSQLNNRHHWSHDCLIVKVRSHSAQNMVLAFRTTKGDDEIRQ